MKFWLMVIVGLLIGKLFGLVGGFIFLALWWGIELLISKNKSTNKE